MSCNQNKKVLSQLSANNLLEYLSSLSSSLPTMHNMEETVHEILTILEKSRNSGGATYSLYFGDQRGQPFFAVGLDNELTVYPDAESIAEELQAFIEQHYSLLQHPRCCIGIWKGLSADGVESLFLDLSVLVYEERVARDFAGESDQIAIFHLATGVEIDTGGAGLPVQGSPLPEERVLQLEARDRLGARKETGNE